MEISIGSPIPLAVQAHDGNPSLTVLAILYDDIGLKLGEVILPHIANGQYASNEAAMPDVRWIVVQYLTNEPKNYAVGIETFLARPRAPAPEKIAIGEIVSKQSVGIIQGVICGA